MRILWYAGASTALAVGVTTYAFQQRANFYSAMVYLSQNNLSLMILINVILLMYGTFVYSLQRLCYGQLRATEVEQLYEKAWFAVTETCLAMTIFREEVGAWFLVMFTALVTGKVWQWIGEGRVEVLEQQPPANPRLFHTRLSISLVFSIVYDIWLFSYAVNTVIQQARPNMMVMFLFEFAILTTDSFRTALRYILSLVETSITKKQTQQRLEERRKQVRDQRTEILRLRESGNAAEAEAANQQELPDEEDIDEMDIEVPGWETKGQWILSLELVADFVKLGVYAAFFAVLMMFYGLPIHIMRDLFMTTRSFLKRLSALIRYRKALQDMNKYPDATEEELGRENTCIICREDMRPWDPSIAGAVERSRPKKLPCGHILHFGCLKSWLERQQVCPTCRRSVVMDGGAPNGHAAAPNAGGQQPAPGQPGANNGGGGGGGGANGNQGGQGRLGGMRMFQLGPLRLGFAQGNPQNLQEIAQRFGMPLDGVNAPAPPMPPAGAAIPVPVAAPVVPHPPHEATANTDRTDDMNAQLRDIAHRLQQEMQSLQATQAELQLLTAMRAELNRLRQLQHQTSSMHMPAQNDVTQGVPNLQVPFSAQMPAHQPIASFPVMPQMAQFQYPPRIGTPSVTRHAAGTWSTTIPAGSPDLPEGVVIPQGWTLMPLQRVEPQSQHSMPQMPVPQTETVDLSQQGPNLGAAGATSVSAERPQSTSADSSTSQAHQATGSSTSAEQNRARAEPPVVAAPQPLTPNWGGSSQLFSNNTPSASSLFPGSSVDRSSRPSSTDGGQSDNEQQQQQQQPPLEPSSSSESPDKGKARAVTIEDAEDTEDIP
ncbi:hypothetical protein PG990_001453 [Apiospora arundinis]|uniref:RING-type E3 ubiquitin transferase n=1 Tax=Apiospora arundinis TaxID=335852 RepID=A0ABR2I366_9PEZI